MGVKIKDRIHFSLELKDKQALLVYHVMVKPLIATIIEIAVEEVSKHFDEKLLEELPHFSKDKRKVKEWFRGVLTSDASGDISHIIEKAPKEKEKKKKELDFDKVFGGILQGL